MSVYSDNADLYGFSPEEYPSSDIWDPEWEPDHSACEADWKVYTEARAAYWFRWPHHCRVCGGSGGTWYQDDPSPPGVSLGAGYMDIVDPCESCTGCPRCGTDVPEDFWQDDEPCDVCGWDWMRNWNEVEACPQPPMCDCQRQRDVRAALKSILGR